MSNPADILRDVIQEILKSEPHADSVLVEMISTSGWVGGALSGDKGGLAEIVLKLSCMVDSGCHGVPILACGLLPGSLVEARVKRLGGRRLMLWQWPGFAYLPYGFTKEELIATARGIIEGARTPLPPGLLPTPGDVLRLTSKVRHWLENRLRNAKAAMQTFERAAGGEYLHASHLEPVAAVSDEHRRMLERLWALTGAAARFAPQCGGLVPLKAAMTDFESRWQALEAVRASLREGGMEGRAEWLAAAAREHRGVCEALSAAIMATSDLDAEITTREKN